MAGDEEFKIKSFVFIDLETSHLVRHDRPTIIEISLISFHRNELTSPELFAKVNDAKRDGAMYDLSAMSLPRVADKLLLCIDPRKETSPTSVFLTGLSNGGIKQSKKSVFDEDLFSLLRLFLKRQEAPVCLIAHNGKRFDFRILLSELYGVTAVGDQMPFQDVFCIDSLLGFSCGFDVTGLDPRGTRVGYSLAKIFQRTFGKEPTNHHCAEDDVISLIKILLPRMDEFAKWADAHAFKLNTVKPYY